jgi:hypothetical protein
VGVEPAADGFNARVRFRRNAGVWQSYALEPIEEVGNRRYYEGVFPDLRPGETVEYYIEVSCRGTPFLPECRAGDRMTFTAVGSIEGRDGAEELVEHRPSDARPIGDRDSAVSRLGLMADDRADPSTRLAVRNRLIDFQRRYGLPRTGVVDDDTRAVIESEVTALETDGAVIDGHLLLSDQRPAADMTIKIFGVGFGGEERLLKTGRTDSRGFYSIELPAPNESLVVKVAANGEDMALTRPVYAASQHETLNLIAPVRVAPTMPEFHRLTAAVTEVINDPASLVDAHESEGQADITFLAHAANWDARPVALLAEAHRLSNNSGLAVEAAYALFRSGMPTDHDMLAVMPPYTIEGALRGAIDCGIIGPEGPVGPWIEGQLTAYNTFARRQRLASRPAGAISTIGQMLNASSLDPAEQDAFLSVIFTGVEGEALWTAAADSGISEGKVKRLQVQGVLGQLTGNNLALIRRLPEAESVDGLSEMVDRGLYEAEAWRAEIEAAAGGGDVADVIPEGYGGTTHDRLRAYSEDLARTVRLSFPTRVIAHKIERDQMIFRESHDARKVPVSAFLKSAGDRGYDIGRDSPRRFVEANPELLNNFNEEERSQLLSDVGLAGRMYQLTPSDEAMATLLRLPFESASEIAELAHADWMKTYSREFPSSAEAELVHRKAQQISAVVYNFFQEVADLGSTPPVFAVHGTVEEHQAAVTAAQDELIKQYPTIESLFGSQDFCECEHCRSVLSPAAYLVDLLHFIDGGENSPFEKLMERRPDIERVPLTCENTHTELPYIDVVNEILEFKAENEPLAGLPNDVGDVESEVLLAEPQNLRPAAYGPLRAALYPIGLPFDLPLETIRGFLAHADLDFADLLELRAEEGQLWQFPVGYGHVFMQQLGIGEAERAILNRSNGAPVEELYGETNTEALTSAGRLARKLDVTYQELTDLVKTWFVNPHLSLRAELSALDIDALDLARLFGADGYDPLSESEEQALRDRLGNRLTTIEENWNSGLYDNILVLQAPAAGCEFDDVVVRLVGGDPIDEYLLRLNLFIRLWRRSEWSIREVDRALEAFIPAGGLAPAAVGGTVETSLLYMAHVAELESKLRIGRRAKEKILTFWADIPLHGMKPLYDELFREAGTHMVEDIFTDPMGFHLPPAAEDNTRFMNDPTSDPNPLPGVQAGLGVSGDDIERILQAQPEPLTLDADAADDARAKLDIRTVSVVYRHAVLAWGLRISVRELLAMKTITGIDPFHTLEAQPQDTNSDHAYTSTIRFVDQVQRVRDAGLRIADLEWLILDTDDTGASVVERETMALDLLTLLRDNLAAITAELEALSGHAPTLTPEQVGGLVGRLFDAGVSDRLMGLWNGTGEWIATPEADIRTQQEAFLADWLGHAAASDLDHVFPNAQPEDRAGFLTDHVIPRLRTRLQRSVTIDALTAITGAEVDLVTLLAENIDVLSVGGQTLANLLPSLERSELSAQFAQQPTALVTDLAVHPGQDNATFTGWIRPTERASYTIRMLPGAPGPSVRLWIGASLDPEVFSQLPPEGDTYEVALDPAQPVRLRLEVEGLNGRGFRVEIGKAGHGSQPMSDFALFSEEQYTLASKAVALTAKAIDLLTSIELSPREILHLSSNPTFGVDLSALPPGFAGMPADLFGWIDRILLYRQLKNAAANGSERLIDVFELSRRRLAAGVANRVERALVDAATVVAGLFKRDVAEVRVALAGLFTQPTSDDAQEVRVTALTTVEGLKKVWDTLDAARKLRVSVSALVGWLTPSPTFSHAEEVRNSIRAGHSRDDWLRTAKAVHDGDRTKPADGLRKKRRNALVAYLLHREGLDQVEDLYERMLIDPGTQPVVTTSRIQLAIASVQLFIQRCLLNLERDIRPDAINADHWAWMRRYRVWEANRKIWLWPQNWLQPEFRDDKTHLYRELEGTLLQEEVNGDAAEAALFTYLRGLDRIARLEIVSMWCEEHQYDRASNTVHVLGRTITAPHDYFYRRYQHRMWTPWEPVPLEIEGDHVVLVKWRDRLHVLWMTFLESADPEANADVTLQQGMKFGELKRTVLVDAQLFRSDFFEGEWSEPTASGLNRLTLPLTWDSFDPGQVDIMADVARGDASDPDGVLRVSAGLWSRPKRIPFVNLNIRSIHMPAEKGSAPMAPDIPFHMASKSSTQYEQLSSLSVSFASEIAVAADGGPDVDPVQGGGTLIRMPGWASHKGSTGRSYRIVYCEPAVEVAGSKSLGSLTKPFFLQDSNHTFFVEPTLTIELLTETRTFGKKPKKPLFPKQPELIPEIPWFVPIIPPDDIGPPIDIFHEGAIFQFDETLDPLIQPGTIVEFEGRPIGRSGSRVAGVVDGDRVLPGDDSELWEPMIEGTLTDRQGGVVRTNPGIRYGPSGLDVTMIRHASDRPGG